MMLVDLRTLQRVLGGEIRGGQLLCPGPGHSAHDRSMAVKLANNEDGFVVVSYATDDWMTCKDYIRQRLGWPAWQPGDGRDRIVPPARTKAFDEAAIDAEAERKRPRSEDDVVRIARAVTIWNRADDPRGTIAEKYLAARALVLDDDVAGTVLRFHPCCPWRDENTGGTVFIPALVAAFRSIDDDAVTGIHRIRLDQPERWPKADRRMLGVVTRAAVKLDAATNVLVIGEGVETCMAGRQMGYAPAWALGSVGAISFFPVLDGVETLRILAEAGEASSNAIALCGRRWRQAGRKTRMVMPDEGCSDLNDELMADSKKVIAL